MLPSWIKTSRLTALVLMLAFLAAGLVVNGLELLAFILIRPFSVHLFRKANAYLVYLHWSMMPWLFESWCEHELRAYGDIKEALQYGHKEKSFNLLNHKGDCDWMQGFCFCDRLSLLKNSKCLMKSFVKYLPTVGIQFYFSDFAFLNRSWDKDQDNLRNMARTWALYQSPVSLFMFAEGTRFTKEKHEKNLVYAREHGLPELKNLLLPRTKGFNLLIRELKESFDAVYDVVIASPGGSPLLSDVIKGKKIRSDFYLRRILIKDIPLDTEEETAKWLIDLYKNKDDLLEHHLKHGCFPGVPHPCPPHIYPKLIAFMWSLILFLPFIFYTSHLILIQAFTQLAIIAFIIIAAYIGMRLLMTVTEVQEDPSKKK